MTRTHTISRWLALCICLLAAQPAGAVVIFQESFEGTDYYSVTGDGAKNKKEFWSVLPAEKLELGFTPYGVDGAAYFGGRKLDGKFGGQSGKNAQREIAFDLVDLTYSIDAVAHISLAALIGKKSFKKEDYIRLWVSLGGGPPQMIDEFLKGKGKKSKDTLVSSVNGSLGSEFAEFMYDLPDDAYSIVFTVEAFTKGKKGAIAIDNFYITNTTISEPTTLALLGLGLAGLGFARRRLH